MIYRNHRPTSLVNFTPMFQCFVLLTLKSTTLRGVKSNFKTINSDNYSFPFCERFPETKTWKSISNTVSVLWQKDGYILEYSLRLREIPRAKPKGFPEGSGYISVYFLTWVTIQTFSITNPALTFPGDQYWKSRFSVY